VNDGVVVSTSSDHSNGLRSPARPPPVANLARPAATDQHQGPAAGEPEGDSQRAKTAELSLTPWPPPATCANQWAEGIKGEQARPRSGPVLALAGSDKRGHSTEIAGAETCQAGRLAVWTWSGQNSPAEAQPSGAGDESSCRDGPLGKPGGWRPAWVSHQIRNLSLSNPPTASAPADICRRLMRPQQTESSTSCPTCRQQRRALSRVRLFQLPLRSRG